MEFTEDFDIVVIGAGHAGCEAALASARLGKKTALFTLSLDQIANLPCNPSIGGSAKGQLVSEIDALGGEMGRAADSNTIQSRMLNRGKGVAVHSLRVQIDRTSYHLDMKRVLENTDNLFLKQAEISEVIFNGNRVVGVKSATGSIYSAKAVIICTGTYLKGKIHIGELNYESGPENVRPSTHLSDCLKRAGIELRRFKTGTPARVHLRSIDFNILDVQKGEEPVPFVFASKEKIENKVDCYITYTNEKTHEIILDNLHRSPLYSGNIEGIGPRYCPSIEDKIVRFKDKDRHQIFIEPVGLNTCEMYIQGMSSSLPEDVQLKFYRTIKGLERVEFMRPAYAIEYDCCNPLDLRPTLEFINIEGLYGAGQFNGTSGYEEAAAQGLIAAINACRKIDGRSEVVLDRSTSYIGVLIDDLVTKGCNDPYRMMTSRSEYRLYIRQDNAAQRLMKIGHEIGLVSSERYEILSKEIKEINDNIAYFKKKVLTPSRELNKMLVELGTSEISTGYKIADLLKRPQVHFSDLAEFDENIAKMSDRVRNAVEIEIKYEGYLKIQLEQIESMKKMEAKKLPENIDYKSISGLRLEAQEKLNKVKPINIGQASRISGVNPADVAVLLVWLTSFNGEQDE